MNTSIILGAAAASGTSQSAAGSHGTSNQSAKTSGKSKSSRIGNQANRAHVPSKDSTGATFKQNYVLAMLRRKEGASVAAIMQVTDWQRHSVHGFLAGVVRKKLKLNLVRTEDGDGATYRIANKGAGAGRTSKDAAPSLKVTRKTVTAPKSARSGPKSSTGKNAARPGRPVKKRAR